jgi:hypothetical protein
VTTNQKRRIQTRNGLLYNLNAPSRRKFEGALLVALYFGLLIGGFIYSRYFFENIQISLTKAFDASKNARAQSLRTIQSIHNLVLANERSNEGLFRSAYADLAAGHAEMINKALPSISQQEVFREDTIRAFFPVVDGSRLKLNDLVAKDANSVDIISQVARGAAIALGYSTFGSLRVEIFTRTAELRFLTTNLEIIMECINNLPEKSILSFFDGLTLSFFVVSILLGLSLVTLGAFGIFSYYKVPQQPP